MIGTNEPRYYESSTGDQLPSVTTVLTALHKPILTRWAINQCIRETGEAMTPRVKYGKTEIKKTMTAAKGAYERELQRTAEIGETVHGFVERILDKKPHPEEELAKLESDEEVRNCVNAFNEFAKAHDIKPLALEVPIEGVGYAGRIDAVVILDGVVTLLDIKTSSDIYETQIMQIAAYVNAYNSDPKCIDKIEACGILRLPKDGSEYEYKDFTDNFYKALAEFMAAAIFWSLNRDEAYERASKQLTILTKIVEALKV